MTPPSVRQPAGTASPQAMQPDLATCTECEKPFDPEDGDGAGTCSVACTDNLRAGDRDERSARRSYERTLDLLDARGRGLREA